MYQNNATRVSISVIAVHVANWQGKEKKQVE